MADIKNIQEKIKKFRDERNWDQFHNTLDLSVAMSIECSEVLELLRFKSREEVNEWLKNNENKKEFSYELADVFIFLLAICNKTNIDIKKAVNEKLEINEKRYPVEKSKDNKDKYDKLG
jgi:NTP pyrophosphatase (non-canonical NTP hydrolase)